MSGTLARVARAVIHPGIGLGIVCGFTSAVLYTLANISLRESVAADPLVVTAMKALPTVFFLTPFLMIVKLRGHPVARGSHLIPRFIFVCLLGQVGGNGSFQIALGAIGLATTVPLTLGSLLIGSAIAGRWMLGETVQRRTAVAMAVLILAVVTLSQAGSPAEEADRSSTAVLSPTAAVITAEDPVLDADADKLFSPRVLGASCAVFSGLCFAVFTATIRLNMQQGMQAASAMWISGVVGSVALFGLVAWRGGLAELSELTPALWWSMGSAGVFNFLAFLAITTAMKILPIVAVHLLNASQVAMAAAAGVVLFDESVTASLLVGITLTMLGLMVLARRPANVSS